LIKDIADYVRDSYQPAVHELRRSFDSQTEEPWFETAAFQKRFIDGVKISFSNQSPSLEPVRTAFVQFLADCHHLAMRNQAFLDAVIEVPEFMRSILERAYARHSAL
jgi:hypothetical protein